MASEYDVFYFVACKGTVTKRELYTHFETERKNKRIYYLLNQLAKHIEITDEHIKVRHNEKSTNLHNLITYCLTYNLDYNALFDETLRQIIASLLCKKSFGSSNLQIAPATRTRVISILEKNNLLLIYKRKPLLASLVDCSFWREYCKTFSIPYKPATKRLDPLEYLRKVKPVFVSEKIRARSIHSSLFMEGVFLTLRETQLLLKEHVAPKTEMKNVLATEQYARALDFAKGRKELTVQTILDLHRIVMEHEQFGGVFRKENVQITNNPKFKIGSWKNIETELKTLLPLVMQRPKLLQEKLDALAYFHNQFQFIHPFIDGNSRLTRLLTFWFAGKLGVPLHEIPMTFITEYLSLTKGYQLRNDKKLARLFGEIVLFGASKKS